MLSQRVCQLGLPNTFASLGLLDTSRLSSSLDSCHARWAHPSYLGHRTRWPVLVVESAQPVFVFEPTRPVRLVLVIEPAQSIWIVGPTSQILLVRLAWVVWVVGFDRPVWVIEPPNLYVSSSHPVCLGRRACPARMSHRAFLTRLCRQAGPIHLDYPQPLMIIGLAGSVWGYT